MDHKGPIDSVPSTRHRTTKHAGFLRDLMKTGKLLVDIVSTIYHKEHRKYLSVLSL